MSNNMSSFRPETKGTADGFGMIIPAGKKTPAPADPAFARPSEESGQISRLGVDRRPMNGQLNIQQQGRVAQNNESSLLMGLAGGLGAAAIGAIGWAMFAYVTGIQIGFIAIGVGVLAGLGVRMLGNGSDMTFGVIGAAAAMLGCLTGDILTLCIFVADQEQMGVFDVISRINLSYAFDLLMENYSFIDIIFYGLALFYGFKYAANIATE